MGSESKEEETGPLSVRVKSKVWKIRQNAFDELIKKFDEASKGDPIFDEFGCDLSKFIADSNPGISKFLNNNNELLMIRSSRESTHLNEKLFGEI